MSYRSVLDFKQTEIAIKTLKDYFERALAKELNLIRVSAPLFVLPETGLNDDLSGVERAVSFDIKQTGKQAQIVQSLAKWKRHALKRYDFKPGEGIYTDMNAIRRDEVCDPIHSIYVDQYDWEKVITAENRNMEYLKETVRSIYKAVKLAQNYINEQYPALVNGKLPEEIYFVSSQELEDAYPDLTPKEREYRVAKEHGAVFISNIGGKLASGKIHDTRAADYDDWNLNGDILLYYNEMDIALEISSMGIRVDAAAMMAQLKEADALEKLKMPYHQAVINGELPLTIGGGIGQSRLCMFLLKKHHIGEVQVSIWPQDQVKYCEERGIMLL